MLGRTGSVLVILVVACNLVDIGLAVSCYNCAQCTDFGTEFDCSIVSSSPYCYMAIDATGSVSRSCGIQQLDDFNFALGCTSADGQTICKCSGDLCNTFEDEIGQGGNGVGGPATYSVSTIGNGGYPADIGLSATCYSCVQCTDFGSETDCRILSSSPYCYMAIDAKGSVSRSCGIENLDDMNFPLGCTSAGGETICKCRGYLCNTFKDETGQSSSGGGPTTVSVAIINRGGSIGYGGRRGGSGGGKSGDRSGGRSGGSYGSRNYGDGGQTADSSATCVNLSSLMASLSALTILARYYN